MNEFLFDENLLTSEKIADVRFPEVENNLILRPLSSEDYEKGFLNVLQQLTAVGDVSKEQFMNRFQLMKNCKGCYYVIVVEDSERKSIVASATLHIEQKFIHQCRPRGRIEDVVVDDNYRKRNIGRILITALCSLSKKLNCYKVTLECTDTLVPFYRNFGFLREPNNSNYLQKRFST